MKMDRVETLALPVTTSWKPEHLEDASHHRLILEHYDRENVSLRRYLSFLGIDRDTGEEILQDCFLKLQEHLVGGGDRRNLRAWLYRVAHNLARNAQSAHRTTKTAPLPELGEGFEPQAQSSTAEQRLLEAESARRFEQALRELPIAQRECLILRAQGMKYREIADATDLAISTVAEHIQRGLARLKELI